MTSNNTFVDPKKLLDRCKVPTEKLQGPPGLRIPYREVADSEAMGQLMAEELAELLEKKNKQASPSAPLFLVGQNAGTPHSHSW